MKDLHSEHWYGETGIGLGQRHPPKQETSVDPTAQAYVAGRVQLSNLQKLAEQQSCYSGPKKNLVKDEWRIRKCVSSIQGRRLQISSLATDWSKF